MDNCIKQCTRCAKIFESAEDIVNQGSRIHVCYSGHLWFNCSCGSTLFLPKGKFEWFLSDLDVPDLYMIDSREVRHIYFDFEQGTAL